MRRTIVLSSCTYTFLGVEGAFQSRELGVGVDRAKKDRLELERVSARMHAIDRKHLPRRTWFMPALAKSSVGSSYGIVDEEGT